MKEGKYEDEFSIMWIENGVGFQVYKKDLRITIDVAKHMVQKRIESFEGKARPVYVDVRNLLTIDAESRKYFASKEAGQLILAGAIHLSNPITRWIANVFMLIDEPITPAKMFTDKDKALHWLQQFKYMN